jgi:hypothetical protein
MERTPEEIHEASGALGLLYRLQPELDPEISSTVLTPGDAGAAPSSKFKVFKRSKLYDRSNVQGVSTETGGESFSRTVT